MTKAGSLWDIEREVRSVLHRARRTSIENAQLIDPGLPVTAYAVFLFVFDNGPVRAREVVEAIGVDKATISRQIAQLEDLGLVARSDDPSDRRAQTVTVTSEGRSKIDAVAKQRRSQFMERLDDWSAEDLAQFAASLSRYNSSLER